jgi:hypothetical protein
MLFTSEGTFLPQMGESQALQTQIMCRLTECKRRRTKTKTIKKQTNKQNGKYVHNLKQKSRAENFPSPKPEVM